MRCLSQFLLYTIHLCSFNAKEQCTISVLPLLHGASSVYWVFCLYSAVRSSVPTSASGRSCTALNAEFCPYKKALSLIFALQIRESAFVLLTMRLLSQRIRSTPNSEKIIRQPSLFQHYALIGAQRVGGVGVVTQQFFGIGPAYGQGLGNFPLPQVAENQQLRLAVVPAIG